ncbi:MAG: hypothetical protein IJD95_03895 [Clostridia bacterium]|nr:hypothetical protein [Clostridia bacterium]
MTAFFMMIGVAALYAYCNLNDKRAISEFKLNGNEFTFLMCAPIAVFLGLTLPFQNNVFVLSWQTFLAILLLTVEKLVEFHTCTVILKQISAFELKAWLGITLIISFFGDLLFNSVFNVFRLICLFVMIFGLALIVKSKKRVKINYRALAVPLFFYIISKFAYGAILKGFASFISPNLLFVIALAVTALTVLPFLQLKKLFTEKKKGAFSVIIARIPNTAASIMENAVVLISLVNYSFIQPLVLVLLFLIDLIKKEPYSRLNLLGSVICIIAFLVFQIV